MLYLKYNPVENRSFEEEENKDATEREKVERRTKVQEDIRKRIIKNKKLAEKRKELSEIAR